MTDKKQTELLLEIDDSFKQKMGSLLSPEILFFISRNLHRNNMTEAAREYVIENPGIAAKSIMFTIYKLKKYFSKNLPKGFVNIHGYSKYAINKHGDVINIIDRRLMKIRISKEGYRVLGLTDDSGKNGVRSIHRLLALTFKYEKGCENLTIDHIDGNKLNNDLDNLEFVTRGENVKRAWEMGINKHGEDCSFSKLTKKEVINVYTSTDSNVDIGKKYDIDPRIVGSIRRGNTWSKTTSHLTQPKYDNSRTKLSEEDVIDIYTSTLTTRELAEKYNMYTSNIRTITEDHTWLHVTKNLTKAIKPKRTPKLTEEDAREIYISNLHPNELAKKYGVVRSNIMFILSGGTWKEATKGLKRGSHKKIHPKLTEEQVKEIYLSNSHPKELAEKYGVNYHTIKDIHDDKNWKKLTKNLIRPNK